MPSAEPSQDPTSEPTPFPTREEEQLTEVEANIESKPLHEYGLDEIVAMESFPRPAGDNGWGIHWIPTVSQDRAIVDRFVNEHLNGLNFDVQLGDLKPEDKLRELQRLQKSSGPVMMLATRPAPIWRRN